MVIEDLDGLLRPHIKGKIIDKKITRLTAPGENYGSLMLKVDLIVQKDGEQEEVFHAVAKCVQPNKHMQEVFNTPTTFKNEIGWYEEAIPTLIQFQQDKGVEHVADYFMNLFGARVSVDPNSENVDDTAVILVENLIERGFKNASRLKGFSLIQSQEILKKLANFHATTIALKSENPELHNKKIKQFCMQKDKFEPPSTSLFDAALRFLEEQPDTAPHVDLIKKNLYTPKEEFCRQNDPLWTTAVHSDFWVNNIMISEDNPPKVIILDLQVCSYESALADLVFFLGTSLEHEVSENHFDDLIQVYYQEFIKTLRELKFDQSKLTQYTQENFKKELEKEGRKEFSHVMFFIPVITAVKETITDPTHEEYNLEDGLKNMFNVVWEHQKEKYNVMIKNWVKHGWL
ncbi:uncharacterized protein LOC126742293 [Anthonomus grandis grandis]|uniref:uncharacterized protein LOC126742293 n=1 Tax=Anthonomus grandis grandis TaxID=2921223 RepID=UPI002165B8F1|nr:uncharacterized protein LOC126742293 [Anthonomus grandis grandis]